MKQTNQWLRAGIAGFGCAILTLLLTALAAKLIESGIAPITGMQAIGYGIIAVSCFAGCLLTAKTASSVRLLCTLLTATVYFLLLCIANGVLQRGEFQRLLPTGIAVYAPALLAALLGAGKKKARYGDYDKMKFAG